MKKNKRYLSFILALTMIMGLAFSTTAFATEKKEENNGFVEISAEEAAKRLNVPVEELKNSKFYFFEGTASELTQSEHVVINPNTFHFFPSFTFSGMHGGSFWTFNGTRMQLSVWNDSGDNTIGVSLFQYQQPYSEIGEALVPPGKRYLSDWIYGKKGADYHFVYYYGNNNRVSVMVEVQ